MLEITPRRKFQNVGLRTLPSCPSQYSSLPFPLTPYLRTSTFQSYCSRWTEHCLKLFPTVTSENLAAFLKYGSFTRLKDTLALLTIRAHYPSSKPNQKKILNEVRKPGQSRKFTVLQGTKPSHRQLQRAISQVSPNGNSKRVRGTQELLSGRLT